MEPARPACFNGSRCQVAQLGLERLLYELGIPRRQPLSARQRPQERHLHLLEGRRTACEGCERLAGLVDSGLLSRAHDRLLGLLDSTACQLSDEARKPATKPK
jgi:hypothetical protein